MSTEPFIGEIKLFGGNFAIQGHAMCQGQLLSIAQNTALFSLLGTTYGGNGQTTFALPDLRGRIPIHQGTGPGLSSKVMGETAGAESVTLVTSQLPAHTHTMNSNAAIGNTVDPANNFWASQPALTQYESTATVASNMKANAIGIAGGSQPHNNQQPYLAINYLIALFGIYPSRN